MSFINLVRTRSSNSLGRFAVHCIRNKYSRTNLKSKSFSSRSKITRNSSQVVLPVSCWGLKTVSRNMSSSSTGKVNDDDKIRRTIMYVPSSNERALEKIKTLEADGFILDIEDAVAPESKATGRSLAVKAIEEYRTLSDSKVASKEYIIRVNGNTTEWYQDDVKAACKSKADALLLPKTETASDVANIITLMEENGAPSTMSVWCMIETPLGILNAAEIAKSSERLTCLVMGTVDLSNDLHCLPNAPGRWNIQVALQSVMIAARAFQKTALDGVYINVKDEQGFLQECRQGRELGFDGKTIIHPAQILANEVFSPSEKEVEHANRVIQAHIDAVGEGKGVATLDGKLVEALHVRDAQRILTIASKLRKG